VSEAEFEETLAAYRRLIERASVALAAAVDDEESAEPELDPQPCP
jgi:predicted pyridoxine 5'-phosphate oxidase superfamily flavin-nucleotide-binding protein